MDKPNLLKKSGNFIQSVIKHTADGFATVPDEIAQERMNICIECEHFEPSNKTCNLCGCFLEVKTTWQSESCPIKKWLAMSTKKPGSFVNRIIEETPGNTTINSLVRPSGSCGCGG